MDRELKEMLGELIGARRGAPIPESPRAIASAKREFDNDPNRRDPKHTQDRMDAAVHKVRVKMGLDRD